VANTDQSIYKCERTNGGHSGMARIFGGGTSQRKGGAAAVHERKEKKEALESWRKSPVTAPEGGDRKDMSLRPSVGGLDFSRLVERAKRRAKEKGG